eukprot:m.265388 g.265388  ORF g.265388 m.265388 type:complete len:90 (-) comp19715_c1_seq59:6807-7076(-)
MSSYSANDGKVIVKRLDAPVPKTCAHRISQLLLGFGPHFERFFGDDYKVHMASTGGLTLFTAEVRNSYLCIQLRRMCKEYIEHTDWFVV